MSDHEGRLNKRRRIYHENDEETVPTRRRTTLHNCFQFLSSPEAPLILSNYLKIAMHTIGVVFIIFILYKVMRSSSEEISNRHANEIKAFERRIRDCHNKYVSHSCGPDLKGLQWQSFCDDWDRKMNPQLVGRTKIATKVLGEILNGLVEPLGLKAMIVILFSVFGYVLLSNLSSRVVST